MDRRVTRGVHLAAVAARLNSYSPPGSPITTHSIYLDGGKHLLCTCDGSAVYDPASTAPDRLGHLCVHIRALYRGPGAFSNVSITPTAACHELFDSIWAAGLLLGG